MGTKKNFIRLGLMTLLFLSACARTPIKPQDIEVEVRREKPPKGCKEVGRVTGKTTSTKPSEDVVIEDLKRDAALKGANFVFLESFSSLGGAAQGVAYLCP